MSKEKKLTPAQREKKQIAAAARAHQRKKAALTRTIVTCALILAAIALIVGLIIALAGSDKHSHTTGTNTGTTSGALSTTPQAQPTGDGTTLDTALATHQAVIEIKDYGTVTLELYGHAAPITVNNFVALAKGGFYNGLTFHRIIEGFMMQGGAPNSSSPMIASIPGEFSANGYVNNLLHKRGVISMARSSVMDSASSQFFIMHQDYPSLDGKYAAFGIVIDGIEVVDAICTAAQPTDGNGSIAADKQPVITSITVTPLDHGHNH